MSNGELFVVSAIGTALALVIVKPILKRATVTALSSVRGAA